MLLLKAEKPPNRADKRKLVFSASAQLPRSEITELFLDLRNIRDKLGARKNRPDLPLSPVHWSCPKSTKRQYFNPLQWETLGISSKQKRWKPQSSPSQIESMTQSNFSAVLSESIQVICAFLPLFRWVSPLTTEAGFGASPLHTLWLIWGLRG